MRATAQQKIMPHPECATVMCTCALPCTSQEKADLQRTVRVQAVAAATGVNGGGSAGAAVTLGPTSSARL